MPFPQTGQLTRVSYPLPPRRKRVRSEIPRGPKRIWLRHRKFVRSHRCVVPGCPAMLVDFHHIRDSANAGIGLKSHDAFGVALCRLHHDEHHSCGVGTFEDRHGIDLYAIAAEFVRRSPDWKMRASLAEAA
jgi:hypothetical protein